MASPHHPPPPPASLSSAAAGRALLDLEVTVVSAKQLKNVNWRQGDLKPYAVAYVDPDRRAATKPDDAGSTRPVWNERLLLPLPLAFDPLDPSLFLTLDLFHSKPSEAPKPLVGTARCPLKDLILPLDPSPSPVKTLELRRPSGRPQGKVRIRLAVRERPNPNYQFPPPSAYYYSPAPTPAPAPAPAPLAPSPARDYRTYSPPPPPLPTYPDSLPPPQSSPNPYSSIGTGVGSYYCDPYSGYYSSSAPYFSAPPASLAVAPARPYYDRPPPYGAPSAPADYTQRPSSYEQRTKGGRSGLGTGLAVGAVAGALGGLALDEGLKYEEEKISERVESDFAPRDDYSDYRADY